MRSTAMGAAATCIRDALVGVRRVGLDLAQQPSRRAGVTLALPADGHGAHPVAASADYSACS